MYSLKFLPEAEEDLGKLKRNEPKAFNKAVLLLNELVVHPKTGTGHPEPLRGDKAGQWSRRISSKHRLVYEIHETEVIVLILTAYGHYEDK
ncbi:MAG: Txe/YoeB family addiction module toxin [Paludibacteraceae bacterium]|jgi:toxin YoeB|nr:Txe/YoeB family addiction module toxin [Paludibacteraceae bacterium]